MYTGNDVTISGVTKNGIIKWSPFYNKLYTQYDHIFHISHNLLLIHQFYHDISFSKFLRKQNKLKSYKNRCIQNKHMDFHYILF